MASPIPPQLSPTSLTISPSSTIHPTTIPSSPLYYLPISHSTHTTAIYINKYTPEILTTRDRSLFTSKTHRLWTITKIPATDAYTLIPHDRDGGKGQLTWTSGWFWGGWWDVEYIYFDESLDRERKVRLKNGGGVDGRWFLLPENGQNEPIGEGILVAEEKTPTPKREVPVEGSGVAISADAPPPEGGETIVIYTDKEEVTAEIRDIIMLAWIAKCWHQRTKVTWQGASAAGGLKYRW